MATFNVGDRVSSSFRDTRGEEGVIVRRSNEPNCWIVKGFSRGVSVGDGMHSYNENYLELISLDRQEAEVRFILQYELESDPFETFSTLKEVEARIKELAKKPELKRESIKVYEISKTYEVKLETRVFFGPKAVLSEVKSGRPRKSDMTEKQKRAAYARAYYKRKKAEEEEVAA